MTRLQSSATPESGELLDALHAVAEALDVDPGATVGDGEIADKILIERAGHARAMLAGLLGRDPIPDVRWSVAYLRARLAEHPATGYRTWVEAVADLKAAQAASASREGR
jgi:hypothetical protein